ncbi:molybdopterin-guanine dinucleotide biosynthesis protein B [Veronia nyctiphanis]|uniref:Molybdopterin-guanine dinucleotide biosynthesis protein B n=1 Tax=Veronia nyctiphanis TaxID=1278244 RepID=A0A4Q0YU45_9GAMM|nr:molybdopterin-guanine dinucleotide biosynthesis protein B [Veronia nyctiphanis]
MTEIQCTRPILGFAAFSGTGKTTLLEKLIPVLTESGLNIAMIKHAHHNFDIDKPGKDSYRLRKAGASQMLISSRFRHALITETPDKEPSLTELVQRLDLSSIDLVLVEGCKTEILPKIELRRDVLGKEWLHKSDSNFIAVACDTPELETSLPILNINNVEDIARFIHEWIKAHDSIENN